MAIWWNPSRGTTLGVEWELQLIDAASKLLRQDAREVISALRGREEAGPQPKIHDELMQSAVEVVTGVCSTVSEAVADLAATIADLQRITDMRGTMLACAGTHPVSDWRDAKMAPVQRYAELVEQMQWLARRIQTFGVHVHVGLRDGSKAIPIVNALAAYLPHFLALTASSPFWGGHDTGLASSRAVIFGGLPTAGPPQLLARKCGGMSGHTLTSARWRSACSTGSRRCGRSAWSPPCRSAWFTCSTHSWTAGTSCPPSRPGSSGTTAGGRPGTGSTPS